MKKSIWTVLFTALVALVAVSCAKEADVKDLKEKVDGLDKRVTALEQAVEKINKETVPGLQNLVNAVNEKLTITSVIEGEDSYTITFSDGTTATIKNGKDGEDGEDGDDAVAPVISITKGTDGIYYWTVDGQLLKDEAGNPIPVTAKGDKGDPGEQGPQGPQGDKGDDGITPLFGTSTDGKVIVSYDNGETWKPLGFSVIDGSAFTSAYIDEEKSTEDYIVLVVGETEVQIPKEKTFSLKITYDGNLNSVGINAGETIALEYAVQGVSSTDEVTVDVLSASAGITAKIAAVDAVSGYIMIGVPAADPEATEPAKIEGKVFVFADNNKGKSNIKVISLEKGEIAAVADVSAQAPAAGGEFELTVTTNKEYNVNINDAASSWLSVVETKATHTDKLKIVAAKNVTGAYRFGTVTINDRNTADKIEEFNIVQQPSDEVATDVASVRLLADGAAVTVKDAIVLAASKNGVLVGDENGGYIYVPLKGNVAVVRGDVVSFTGVKKTNETTGAIYVETSVIEDDDYEGEIPDLTLYYYGYASENDGANSIHTTFIANLDKNEETGAYVAVPFYGQKYVVEAPLSEYNVENFDGKLVAIEGYTNGGIVEDTSEEYSFIVTGIKEVTYTDNANWKLSWDLDSKTITNTVSGDSSEWYGIFVCKASIVGSEDGYASIDELIKDAIPYSQDEVQFEIIGEYNGLPVNLIVYYVLDDSIMQGTGSLSLDIPYGEYIAIAYGMEDETFNATGNYAVLEFDYPDPHVPATYDEFIGQWSASGSVYAISEKVKGESYSIEGMSAQGPVEAIFADGALQIYEQDMEGTMTSSYGTVEDLAFGGCFQSSDQTYYGYKHQTKDTKNLIMTIGKLGDGTYDVTPGYCTIQYKDGTSEDVKFTGYGMHGVLGEDAGMYAGYHIAMTATAIPSVIEVYVPYSPALPFKEDFEVFTYGNLWTFIDADKDGYKWTHMTTNCVAYSGVGVLASASYQSKALNPNNWAFTPGIEMTTNNYLSFWVAAQDVSYPEEHYAVYITDQTPSASTLDACTKLHEATIPEGEPVESVMVQGKYTYQHFVIAIPEAYQNKTCYIGFRHFNCTDMFRINIDDVEVTEGVPSAGAPSYAPSTVKNNNGSAVYRTKVFKNTNKAVRSLKHSSEVAPATIKGLNSKKNLTNGIERRK